MCSMPEAKHTKLRQSEACIREGKGGTCNSLYGKRPWGLRRAPQAPGWPRFSYPHPRDAVTGLQTMQCLANEELLPRKVMRQISPSEQKTDVFDL